MLWQINNTQAPVKAKPGVTIQLPVLQGIPTGSNASKQGVAAAVGQSAGGMATTTVVNVANDFYWTYSPKSSRIEVPVIYLKEKQLQVNALVSQLKYTLGIVGGVTGTAATSLANGVTSVLNSAAAAAPQYKNVFNDMASGAQQVAGQAGNVTTTAANYVSSLLNLPDDQNTTVSNSTWLQPYNGLYVTRPTGWEYIFPYFDDKFEAHGNSFSAEASNAGALGGLVQIAANAVTEFATIAGTLASPYKVTYIEHAKFYNYPTDGEDISFSFPLINTGSVDYSDVVNNWQLLFLLLYNNKPGRISPTTLDQPVIYEVEIPGTRFFPYCYISSIDIKFQGARRELQIQIPSTSQAVATTAAGAATSVTTKTSLKTITTIVPDAYYVTITLKSMLANSKNFMYHMIDNGSLTVAGTLPSGPSGTATPGGSVATS